MKKIFLCLLPAALMLAACGKSEKPQQAENAKPPAKEEVPALATPPVVYTAAVNDLRLRETPDLNAKVVVTLKQGDKMTATGNKSTEKVTVELRGQKMTDVFYEVTTSDGKKAWAFAGGVTAQSAAAADNANDMWMVSPTAVGKITANTTEQDLINLYGKNNVTPEKEIYANADVPPFQGVSIFRGKADELLVAWEEGKKGKAVAAVFIRNAGGQWHTAQGVKVGMSLGELQKINGKPFNFTGFGWDYGGYVGGWEGGKLDGLQGVSIRLDGGNAGSKYQGDVSLRSDDKGLTNAGVKVSELAVSF